MNADICKVSTNRLYLFSKETDATATEQGYHYQKIKTLKTWLENRISGKDEVIYCDTDDDIVQRDFAAATTRFRQIKLYSSNFSFSTEEVTKSLANFFMLFTKGEYLFDEATFIFETNANIAKETRGNDADLLRDWAAHQGELNTDLLAKCIIRVKEIMDPYIAQGYVKEKAKDVEGAFLKAKKLYEQLPEDFWEKFVQAISWQFEVVPQNEAIPRLTAEIEQLIEQLPLPVNSARVSSYVATLHWEIVNRTIDPNPERRLLDNGLLDYLVLHQGDEQDKWYAHIYDKWAVNPAPASFNVGQYLEAIAAIRYCRWDLAASSHVPLWLNVMQHFIQLADNPMPFRRKAIYEYLFLKMQASRVSGQPDPTLVADAPLVTQYFENLGERYELADIEEDISFLQIVTAESQRSPGFAEATAIEKWSHDITAEIESRLIHPRDINEHCLLLELKGTACMQLRGNEYKSEKVKEAMGIYRIMIPLLPDADTYTVTRLSDMLKQIGDLYTMLREKHEDSSDEIAAFRREISSFAPQADIRHKQAQEFISTGAVSLKKGGARNFLRAIDNFHQAGKLYRMDETMDAYILALLNMAQVYNALGANFAGKYYALCGVWSSVHTGDEKALAKIADSYGLVFHADFLQGAWISAMSDYIPYMNHHNEVKTGDPGDEEMVNKNFLDLALMVEVSQRVFPELLHLIDFYKTQLGGYYREDMGHLVEPIKAHIAERENLQALIAPRVVDTPFNDVGKERVIRFKMLGVSWYILFGNTYVMTALAEEFTAILQVILCEIGLSGADLQLPVSRINIKVIETPGEPKPIRRDGEQWIIAIPHRDEHKPEKARKLYWHLGTSVQYLVTQLSSKSKEEISVLFQTLYKKQQMGEKALSSTTYQRAFFKAFEQSNFDRSARQHFGQVPSRYDYPLTDSLAGTIRQGK
ncbi:dsDNA nuclease domain-containing protein [Mucilaginibacter agri]|uniref:DUF4297 domain-containing protein n=1 Tax=Mucilaginibacter agri TaxID=2695265 RepID=A0A965ZD26_9SPHI|nr:dsDNA nuclease domain-containing protein [Mucilaginibacter agri]NCD67902.1 DUF4297 domain-containing protein [Mucilaginibacter agri]